MIEARGNSVVLRVRVIPRADRSAVAGTRDGALLVRLQAAPVDGAANAELVRVVAHALGVPKRSVTIVGGERARTKRLSVTGIGLDMATAKLMRAATRRP